MPIIFNNNTKQTVPPIGSTQYDQIWFHMVASATRGNDTWYQNTTGQPIQVAIGMYKKSVIRVKSPSGCNIKWLTTGSDPSESGNFAIIPENYCYCTTGEGSTNSGRGKRYWAEFADYWC